MSLKVNFDRSMAAYLPGEIVKGTVDLELKKPLHTRTIAIILRGTAGNHWTETTTSYYTVNGVMITDQYTIPRELKHYCAWDSVCVWSDGSKKPQLNTGKYMFSFCLRLPDHCPPSFNGKHGEIAYEISVGFDCKKCPFKGCNSRSFRVFHLVDLNTMPVARSPVLLEKEKHIGLRIFPKGTVTVNLSIPKRGFVSGEIIPVFCDVNNDSSKPIVKAKVKLYKRISYGVAVDVEKEVLAKARKELAILPNSRYQVSFHINVPRRIFPSLDLRQCSMINIDYYLEIKFTSKSLFNKHIKFSPSVVIGVVPVLEPTAPLDSKERVADHKEKNEQNNNDTKEASSPYASHHSSCSSMSLEVDLDRKVTFDGSTAMYMPGDVVSGTVVLRLKKPLRAGSLTISFKGYARTAWTGWEDMRVYPYVLPNMVIIMISIPSYETTVTYTSTDVTAWSSNGSKKQRLPPGEHRFPFEFPLPDDCPPTFQGKNGRIAYELSVETDRKWPFKISKSWNITVIPFVDLKTESMATEPIRLEEEKKTGPILFRNGNVSVSLNIPKSGFVPGEVIPVLCDINNNSSNPVVKAKMKLCKRICYESGNTSNVKTRKKVEVLAKAEKELTIPRKSRSEVQLELTIPPTFPTMNKLDCSIINFDYYLKIKFTTRSLLNKEIKLRPSVLIGTLPVIVVEPSVPSPAIEINVVGPVENEKENNNNVDNECPPSPVCLLLNPIYQEESPDF